MKKNKSTRRDFLKGAASAATGAALTPYVITSAALGNSAKAPASERVALGHIGVGSKGSGLMQDFSGLKNGQTVAVCDPFTDRREKQASLVKGCTAYADFRELLTRDDIDAVIVATTDHWHVPAAIAAARAGKDMYVEKPLGLSIEHNKAMREAVHRYGSIFQYGTQQRSFRGHCSFACEMVRNGRLGEIKEIRVTAPGGETGGSTVPIPLPKGFDYDMWLGSAPKSPYTKDRCTSFGSWFVYANSVGFLGGWGAHPLDIMHWGYPHIPVEYEGTGVIPTEGLYDTVVKWNIHGRFANGVKFSFTDAHGDNTTFVGTEGWIRASRGSISAEPKSLLSATIKPGEIHLRQSHNHYQNFLDAVQTRSQPTSDIDSAVQSDFISHLSDIAVRVGRKIKWDPIKEEIIGDEVASRMASRPMRSPWRL